MGGVEIVGFHEMEGANIVRREGKSWLDTEEEGAMRAGEFLKRREGGGQGSGGFHGGAIRTEEVFAEGSGMLDEEGGKIVAREAISSITFELLVLFPGG